MLYRLHHTYFLVGFFAVGFLAVVKYDRAFNLVTLGNVIAYVSQFFLLIYFSREKYVFYTKKALFGTVLVYYLLMCSLFMYISYVLDDDTFMFCKQDAWFYYTHGMDSAEIGFLENAKGLVKRYPFDDWGALLMSSFLMSIIPHKLFMNALYMLLGAISSVMLFHMGKRFMPEVYAFEAALAYGISSYMVFLHCTFLKESLFLFLVISSIYFFFRAAIEGKYAAFIGVVVCTGLAVFFRPAVAAFLVMSFVAYYAISQRGSAFSLFLYVVIAGVLAVSMAFMQDQFDTYTGGGDRENVLIESSSKNYSGSFNFFVGWLAALFGPFPTLFPVPGRYVEYTVFYWPGLVYRLFLAFPFWIGVFYIVKRRCMEMIPIIVFVMVELLASGYVLASFELRKVVLHVPFMYILSFYGLYQLGKSKKIGDTLKQWVEISGYAFTIGILILWNVIRVH